MSALVFGSPEANAIVEQLRRIEAMPDSERRKHEPDGLREAIAYADRTIEQLERDLLMWQRKRRELAQELNTWRLLA